MTTITVVASGTRGDVQPYLALAQGLQRAGYTVRLVSSDNFATLAAEAGLEFGSMGFSAEERLQSDEWRQRVEGGNFLKILQGMQSEMKSVATDMARRLPPLLDGSDVIVTGVAGTGGVFTLAEQRQIPVIQAYVFPFTPTTAFPAPITTRLPLGSVLNPLSFRVLHQMFWQMSKAGDAAVRREVGLRKPPFWGPFAALDRTDPPVLYGYSAHVLPRPGDWSARYNITGYWFLDEPEGWQPSADLVDFLNAGEPPVYIGFGSMSTRNPEASGQIALDALRRSGQRGVLASGWGGLKPTDLPDSVHLISALPHSWLFPRMAAVVHHGGAGTTAAGFRAGVPSIMVPFGLDQPFWGSRTVALGVGPSPIPRKQLTGARLADAITTAVTNQGMRQQAADLGQKIRAEDGIGQAVASLDRYLQSKR